jgi:predicted metal-binding protein
MDFENLSNILIRLSDNMGLEVVEIREIKTENLEVDVRNRWKCRFGCNYYGKRYSCPPNVPDDYEDFLRSYSRAILFRYRFEHLEYIETKKKAQKVVVAFERAVLTDYPLAFALFPGGCDLCDECSYEKKGTCQKSHEVRPSLSSMGLKVSDLGVELGDQTSLSLILLE